MSWKVSATAGQRGCRKCTKTVAWGGGGMTPSPFMIELQGNLGGHIWFVWAVAGWGSVGMFVVTSDERPRETTLH